jgi:FAD/FMN-containing dehydrogenase
MDHETFYAFIKEVDVNTNQTIAWEKIVGAQGVVTDSKILHAFSNDFGFTEGLQPVSLVRPRKTEEVHEIVKRAKEKRVALVPRSSTGPRWRGDTVPQVENSVIVDMSVMNEILRMDPHNKVAMIQPGVTFGTLQSACLKVGRRVPVPLLPRSTKSVMASYLEREPHTIPKYHWDMSDPMCCMELVFGTGDRFITGGAAGPGTLEQQWAAGQAQKSPMGPAQVDYQKIIHGSQGTMGIATWATIKLEVLPQAQKAFFVGANRLENLTDFTYAIMRAKLPDECFILNHTALASILAADSKERDQLAKGLPQWLLFYAVAGYERFPQERIEYITMDIADLAKANNVQPVKQVGGISAGKFIKLLSLPGADPHWKVRHQGGCQDIFFINTLDRAHEFVKECLAACSKYNFPDRDCSVYIQPIQQGRNVHIEFNFQYNPEDASAVNDMRNLYNMASSGISELGGFFSRPYGLWSDLAYRKCPDTVKALQKVKNIFDPAGIMNPGRLCFRKGVDI